MEVRAQQIEVWLLWLASGLSSTTSTAARWVPNPGKRCFCRLSPAIHFRRLELGESRHTGSGATKTIYYITQLGDRRPEVVVGECGKNPIQGCISLGQPPADTYRWVRVLRARPQAATTKQSVPQTVTQTVTQTATTATTDRPLHRPTTSPDHSSLQRSPPTAWLGDTNKTRLWPTTWSSTLAKRAKRRPSRSCPICRATSFPLCSRESSIGRG